MPDLDVTKLANFIKTTLDRAKFTLPPEYSYASLPLCVIDSVFSIGVKYETTFSTVLRWCKKHNWSTFADQGEERTIDDFLQLYAGRDAETMAVEDFANRQRTSSRSGILKADAAKRFAEVLASQQIQRKSDIHRLDLDGPASKAIASIPGQKSGISFKYFLMLAGSDTQVKADRMICRYVGTGMGWDRTARPDEAEHLLTQAAYALEIPPRTLDYAVWDYQRRQPRKAPQPPRSFATSV